MKKLFLFVFLILAAGIVGMIVDERLEVARLKDISPVVSPTLPVVLVSSDDAAFELQLYENDAARSLLKQLPMVLVMNRWGDGGYGGVLAEKANIVSDKKNQRRAFFKGEVVWHQKRNTLFLMFGPTPVGLTVNEPMLLAFGGIPIGRLKNYAGLNRLPGVVEFSFQIKK